MWWRRDGFNAAYGGTQPKWHFSEEAWKHGRNVAVCGYSFDSTLQGLMLQKTVKTAALRCSKCDQKLAAR